PASPPSRLVVRPCHTTAPVLRLPDRRDGRISGARRNRQTFILSFHRRTLTGLGRAGRSRGRPHFGRRRKSPHQAPAGWRGTALPDVVAEARLMAIALNTLSIASVKTWTPSSRTLPVTSSRR